MRFVILLALVLSCVQEVSAPPDARPIDAGCVPAAISTPACEAQLVCPSRPYPAGCVDQVDGTVCCTRT